MRRLIRTTELDVEVRESGSPDGFAVVLVHGFPDSAGSWDAMVPSLVDRGCRVIAPSLRGFGDTRFLRADTPRIGQTAAFASDLIQLCDEMGLDRCLLVGHDIGASTAMLATPLLAERVAGLLLLAPNLGGSNFDEGSAFAQARAYWYKWYFCTDVGRDSFATDPKAFCRKLWRSWSPTWDFDDACFEEAATAFENPDFLEVVMHFYRHTSGEATGSELFDQLERRSRAVASLDVPTIVIHGSEDACTLPKSSLGRDEYFVGGFRRETLPGVGHFVQREAPKAVLAAAVQLLSGGGVGSR